MLPLLWLLQAPSGKVHATRRAGVLQLGVESADQEHAHVHDVLHAGRLAAAELHHRMDQLLHLYAPFSRDARS